MRCRKFVVAIAAINLGATAVVAATPAVKSAPATKSAAAVPTGPGSLAGFWVKASEKFGEVSDPEMFDPRESVMKTADGSPLPIRPEPGKIVEQRLKDAEAGHPFATTKTRCLPPGVPDMIFNSGPIQILETPGQITILRQEFTFFRVIHMNRGHLKDPDPDYLGDSVGHWEGGTLVVDTIGISDKTTIKSVIPHSEDLHVVERFRRISKDRLEVTATVDDPKTFTRPWTITGQLRRLPDNDELMEYFCENNRNGPDANGNTSSGSK